MQDFASERDALPSSSASRSRGHVVFPDPAFDTPEFETEHYTAQRSTVSRSSHYSFDMELAKGIDDEKHEPTHEYVLEENTTPLVAPPAEHAVTYRPDIDGIRALAIVPVVIFHAYTWHLRGGLIGVDIFFVISGYLISGILFKEFAKQKFTYANFYSRRIRRIFPALILVLAFTLIMGYLWADKMQMKALAETMYAGGLFGANIELLLVELGEDRMSIFLNPLLHLWSLGVEEQFYIFWPLFASLVVRMPPRFAIMSQVIVIAVSFWFNMYFLDGSVRNRSYPGQVTLLGHTTKLNISPSPGRVKAPYFVIL
ncbi:hypothetical protein AC1031_000610 [Aphanomyces cochlioides]|nr:hypothetical protein AC1031_000610 [Aphanomyces cochlioides]